MIITVNDRWRLTEDGELLWNLECRAGKRWLSKARCGTKAGLIEVALPHHRVAIQNDTLALLELLPDFYEVGALERISAAQKRMQERQGGASGGEVAEAA